MTTKITSANIDTTSVATATSANTANFNIALLGFKMAITEGLTVFNLVDGIVDEFEDEGGTDGSASTNLTYNSTDDYYINSSTPNAQPTPMASYSAGFGTTSVTEPDTSTAGSITNASQGNFGTFTVPTGMTSLNAYVWSSSSSAAGHIYGVPTGGIGGSFTTGTLAVTPGQTIYASAGDKGDWSQNPSYTSPLGAFLNGNFDGNAGLSGVFANTAPTFISSPSAVAPVPGAAPQIYLISGSPGNPGLAPSAPTSPSYLGGVGGGLTGGVAGNTGTAQTSRNSQNGGGGSQTVGGQGGTAPSGPGGQSGVFLAGGCGSWGSGGVGYYGGGGGIISGAHGGGGGGSSYYGHPQITSGATTSAGVGSSSAGSPSPLYVPGTGQGGAPNPSGDNPGQPGYVLFTGSGANLATTTTSTIISDPFTSNTVPTTTRLVVFEENVGSPTLNTDIIASVSRNGGTNFTTVTLTDSGYVTGASGQRILTGQASVSGQPSGQSMKWKLELANQTVKIHGVSLQWS